MLTRRSPKPVGLDGDTTYYSFFARLDRQDCEVLKEAQKKAWKEMGCPASNGLFLMEVLKAYLGETVR